MRPPLLRHCLLAEALGRDETWLVANPTKLAAYNGQGFQTGVLPTPSPARKRGQTDTDTRANPRLAHRIRN